MRCGVWCCFFTGGMVFAWPSYILLGSACVKKTVQCICSMHLMGHLQHGMFLLFTRTTTASSKNRNKSIRWYIQGNDWSDWTTNKWDPFEKNNFSLWSMWPGGHAVHAVSFFAWPDSTSWWCVCVRNYRDRLRIYKTHVICRYTSAVNPTFCSRSLKIISIIQLYNIINIVYIQTRNYRNYVYRMACLMIVRYLL